MNKCLFVGLSVLISTHTFQCMEENRSDAQMIKDTYRQTFYNYFFTPDTVSYLFEKTSGDDKKKPTLFLSADAQYAASITSKPNKAHEYPNNASCAIEPDDGSCEYIVAFNDGNMLIKRHNEPLEAIGTGGMPSISALARGKGKFDNALEKEACVIAGCNNGSVLFLTGSRLTKWDPVDATQPIACISPGPIPHSWMSSDGNEVSLYRSHASLFENGNLQLSKATARIPAILCSKPLRVVGLGTHKNCIVIQLNQDNYALWSPYSQADIQIMSECHFSLPQACCIDGIIKAQENRAKAEEDAHKNSVIFNTLPQIAQSIISLKSATIFAAQKQKK